MIISKISNGSILLSFLLVMTPTVCSAYIFGGSNLPLASYDEFHEMEPGAPYNRDEYSFNRYRSEVQSYVERAEEYVKNGNNDIERIKEAQKDAIDKANRVVDEFNQWARRTYP